MKKFSVCFIGLLLTSIIALSQGSWMEEPVLSDRKTLPKNNLFSMQELFYNFWNNHEANQTNESENIEEGGYQQFKRWEYLMRSRVDQFGNLPEPAIIAKEFFKYKELYPEFYDGSSRNANWQPVGTAVVPGNGGGAGRVNVIQFHPNNSDIIFLGTAGGGLWKTEDGGINWIALTDFALPVTSIADVAINPIDPQIMYVATGDGYGYEISWQSDYDFWGGVYTSGIFKSTDGGFTWQPTGLSYLQEDIEIVQRLIIHPTNPDILIAATRNGIFRTTDAGNIWNQVSTQHCYDFAFNTSDPDIIYTGSEGSIYYSQDAGATWSILETNVCYSSGRMSIETSAANANRIYCFCQSGEFVRSNNGGSTWQTMSSPTSETSFYGYYDCALACSDVDEDRLLAGGLETVRSVDGGNTWNKISSWDAWPNGNYVHADNHACAFLPGSSSVLFSGNDGGLFKRSGNNDWEDLSNGLQIAQMYRLGTSLTNPDLVLTGWQDNGVNRWNGTDWDQVVFADGMEVLIDYSDPDIMYSCIQNGWMYKSIDGGNNWDAIGAPGGPWVTPFVIDPVNPDILYYGSYGGIYKSTNGGNTFNNTSAGISGDAFALAVAPSDHLVVYGASLTTIVISDDGGNNWTDITGSLPLGSAGINYIAISDYDPNLVWIALSGYQSGDKVFSSADGGQTWMNVSGTLPNVPVNTIVYQNNSNDILYIGTDIGVFYKDGTMNDWLPYMIGLPNVMVHELEINYTSNKLLAATYGRGIWQSDLAPGNPLLADDVGAISILHPQGEYCSTTVTPQVQIKNFGGNTVTSFDLSYSLDGGTASVYNWTGTLNSLAITTVTLPAINGLTNGAHTFSVLTSFPNGVSDNNSVNDDAASGFSIVASGIVLPLQEGFETALFPPAGWMLENTNGLWSLNADAGGFGLSVQSARSNFYSIYNGADYIISPHIDLSNVLQPITLKFDVAYAVYPGYSDTLRASVSTDCGQTWTSVYEQGGYDLATAPETTGLFIPQSNEWVTEVVNLNSFFGNPAVMIRFEAQSGYGNLMYLDNINLTEGNTSTSSLTNGSISVFPNPGSGIFMLTSSYGISTVKIFDVLGQLVFESKEFDGNEKIQIDLNHHSKGTYLIRISDEGENVQWIPLMLE